MKNLLGILAAVALAFAVLVPPVRAQEEPKDPAEEEEDAFGNIMNTSFPVIGAVKFARPAAGSPCKVSAEISMTGDDPEAKVTSVRLIYYVDGAMDKPNDVAMAPVLGGCEAEIPAMAAGTKMDFIIRVESSNGNVATQAVPSARGLVETVPDMDNSEDIVSADLDILGVAVGYDADNVYVRFNVQGKITGGTEDPPFVHGYCVKVTNPDIEKSEGLMAGKMLAHMPLVKGTGHGDDAPDDEWDKMMGREARRRVVETGTMLLDIAKMVGGKTDEAFPDVKFSATADGGTLSTSIARGAFGENPSGCLRILAMTVANASFDSFMPIPYNCSHFVVLYTSSQEYSVE
jgi:hypothetical protein